MIFGNPSFLNTRKYIKTGEILRKHKQVRLPGQGAKHPPGWKSAACKKKDHGTCHANACACVCHERGML